MKKNKITIDTERTVLFSLSTYRFGDTVQGDMNEVETSANKDMLTLHKRLFCVRDNTGKLVECPQWKKIKSIFAKINVEVNKRSVPVYSVNGNTIRLRRGIRLVNVNMLADIEDIIRQYEKQAQNALEEFLMIYPIIQETAKQELNDQFKETDYPTIEYIRNRFGVTWCYIPVGIPERLPKEILERELKSTVESNQATAEECRLALRTGLLSLMEHLKNILAPVNEGDKKKRFFASNLDRIIEFQNMLKFTDMTDDKELRDLAEKARKLVENANPKEIRTGGTVAESMIKGASEIAETLKGMVGEVKGRKFNLDD